MAGVSRTLFGTLPARKLAQLERAAQKLQVRLLLPRKHVPGGLAHVGAIEIQPDASSEHLDVVLAEARVYARDAGLRAVNACVDTPRKRVFLNERSPRGGPRHFRHGLVHGQPPWALSPSSKAGSS